MYRAINKYGIENFSIETLEETENPEEREKYWIEYFGSFKNGYNATIGGDGKPYIDRDLVVATYNEVLNCREVARRLNISKDSVSNILNFVYLQRNIAKSEKGAANNVSAVCHDKHQTAYGFKWKFVEAV